MRRTTLAAAAVLLGISFGCSGSLTPSSPYNSPEDRAFMIGMYDDFLKVWPEPFEEVTIPTDIGETHVLVNGPKDGPVTVLFHGAMASALMWKDVVARLSRTHRTIAVDIPGHFGKSVPTKRDVSDEELAAWVNGILDHFGAKKALVLGTSFGGWVSMKYASLSPERVDRLVLIATSPGSWRTSFKFVKKAIKANRTGKREDVREMVKYMHAPCNEPPPQMIDFMAESMRRGKPAMMKPGKIGRDELAVVTCPVLAIAGRHDNLFDPDELREVFEDRFSNLEFHVVEGAGHFVFAERPEETLHLIDGFLGR